MILLEVTEKIIVIILLRAENVMSQTRSFLLKNVMSSKYNLKDLSTRVQGSDLNMWINKKFRSKSFSIAMIIIIDIISVIL